MVFRLNWYLLGSVDTVERLVIPTEASSPHQALEQRAEHDALGDRDHKAEATWCCDVGGVSRGDHRLGQ
jgi:hypothetical protein